MATRARPAPSTSRPKRADARRNEQALLDAAARIFVTAGVNAPIRQIAAEAGVGTATIYRHFPARADLIVAVYRHQVDTLAEAAPTLLGSAAGPYDALVQWIDRFVDFLVTKLGLAEVMQSDDPCFDPLHDYFLERLVPACAQLVGAAAERGEIRADIEPLELMRGVGNLCAGAGGSHGFDARRLVGLLVAGLRLG